MYAELLAMVVAVAIGLALPRVASRFAAIFTLFADAYLVLALMATQRMRPEYHHYLPPFGFEAVHSIPRVVWSMFIFWTAILSAISLGGGRKRPPPEP